ncbi:MAG: efflux RND transporter periplasmic adaptor subunit [Xanthomonadales bacterium]|nr:efflux RND transporter periplasmic adaptor subunit [Xanthomonadales bacterium]
MIHAGGVVEPAGEERLIVVAESAGRIARIHVAEGDPVRKGQLIAEIAADDLKARVLAAERQIEVLQAERALLLAGARPEERALARARFEAAAALARRTESASRRAEALGSRGLLAEDQRESLAREAEAAAAEARAAAAALALAEAGPRPEQLALLAARIRLAEAELEAARAALAKTRIESPLDGTVLRLLLREGELVAPLDPKPVASLGDLSRRYVRAEVDELDVARLRAGLRAEVRSEAFPGRTYRGEVERVGLRMGRRLLRSDDPVERRDARVLEALIRLEEATELPIGLRVDVTIYPAP